VTTPSETTGPAAAATQPSAALPLAVLTVAVLTGFAMVGLHLLTEPSPAQGAQASQAVHAMQSGGLQGLLPAMERPAARLPEPPATSLAGGADAGR
jgi:hypothetical protein